MSEKQSFLPTLTIARDHTAFYSHSRFWEYRSDNLLQDLSFTERKVQYAIEHEVYSFSLSVEEQKLVKEGRAGLDVTRKNYKRSKSKETDRSSEFRISDSEKESDNEDTDRNSMVNYNR